VRQADGLEWDTVVRLKEDRTELVLALTVVSKALPPLIAGLLGTVMPRSLHAHAPTATFPCPRIQEGRYHE
jgi:hypothetical protein